MLTIPKSTNILLLLTVIVFINNACGHKQRDLNSQSRSRRHSAKFSKRNNDVLEPKVLPSRNRSHEIQKYTVTKRNLKEIMPSNMPSSFSYSSSIPTFARSESRSPSIMQSEYPTIMQSEKPSEIPKRKKTPEPTPKESNHPSRVPSFSPTKLPTINPTNQPTHSPSVMPTFDPSVASSNSPTISHSPTSSPVVGSSPSPTIKATSGPTNVFTANPSNGLTNQPSTSPSNALGAYPSANPTFKATNEPSAMKESSTTSEPSFEVSRITLSMRESPKILLTAEENGSIEPLVEGSDAMIMLEKLVANSTKDYLKDNYDLNDERNFEVAVEVAKQDLTFEERHFHHSKAGTDSSIVEESSRQIQEENAYSSLNVIFDMWVIYNSHKDDDSSFQDDIKKAADNALDSSERSQKLVDDLKRTQYSEFSALSRIQTIDSTSADSIDIDNLNDDNEGGESGGETMQTMVIATVVVCVVVILATGIFIRLKLVHSDRKEVYNEFYPPSKTSSPTLKSTPPMKFDERDTREQIPNSSQQSHGLQHSAVENLLDVHVNSVPQFCVNDSQYSLDGGIPFDESTLGGSQCNESQYSMSHKDSFSLVHDGDASYVDEEYNMLSPSEKNESHEINDSAVDDAFMFNTSYSPTRTIDLVMERNNVEPSDRSVGYMSHNSNSILSHEPITPNSYRNNSVQPFSKEEEALSVICNSIQPQDGKIEYIEVEVPAGMLGVATDSTENGPPVVDAILPESVLSKMLVVGDRIVKVDECDTSRMSAEQLNALVSSRRHNTRKFGILRVHFLTMC